MRARASRWSEALLFALLGGLIPNLMPCVFLGAGDEGGSFRRLAGHERSAMRRDGIASIRRACWSHSSDGCCA